MNNFNNQGSQWCNQNVMDILNVLSFIIGLQNLNLNITSQDLDKQTKTILDEVHAHLANQDKHLEEQDVILKKQEKQLEKLEYLINKLEAL